MDRHHTPSVLVAGPPDRQPFWEAIFSHQPWAVTCCELTADAVCQALAQSQPDLLLLDLPRKGEVPGDIARLQASLQQFHGPWLCCVGDTPPDWLNELPAANGFLPRNGGATLVRASLDKLFSQHQRWHGLRHRQKQRCLGQQGLLLASRFARQNRSKENASVVWLGMANPGKWPQILGPGAFADVCLRWFERLDQALKKFTVVRLSETSAMVLAGSNPRQTRQWFGRLRDAFRQRPLSINGHSLTPDLCGVALSHFGHHDDLDNWLLRGELRLAQRQSKTGEGDSNELEFLGEAPGDKQYHLVKTQLQQAIADRRFSWLYQPFVSRHEDGYEKYQLMMRVITSSGKELAGKDYIDVARRSGLLEQLDNLVLEQAIRWLHQAPEGHRYCLLLNQDLKSFTNPHQRQARLRQMEAEIHARNNDSSSFSHQLVIQFEASDATTQMAFLEETGEALHQAGVTLCLTGFTGTGEQWQALEKLRADWVRTVSPGQDRAFFEGGGDSPFASLVQQAHRSGLRVFVPQVDNMEQMASLWAQDVDYLQGYFIQRPATEVEFSFSQQSL